MSVEGALRALEIPDMDMDSLLVAVRESIDCVRPWRNARSDLPLVMATLISLQSEIQNYSSALQLSMIVADNGADFAEMAQKLCKYLQDKNTSEWKVKDHIRDMKALASRAHGDAMRTTQSFRDSRTKLNQVAKCIPGDKKELSRQQAHQNARYDQAEGRRSDAMVGAVIKSIIFPIGIPWFVSGAIDTRRSEKRVMKESRNEAARCAAARGELCRIENGIGNMAGHIDNLVNWWIRVEALLDKVNENVTSIRASKGNKIRFEGMHSGWGAIKAKYLEYKSEVMAEQSTTRFKQLAFSSTGTGNVLDATQNRFVTIELWYQVRSDNPEVQAVFRSAMQEAKAFRRSIDQSLQTAQAGYSFAEDAILLCDCLLEPRGAYCVEELTEYIEDIQTISQTAYSQAKAVSDMFISSLQSMSRKAAMGQPQTSLDNLSQLGSKELDVIAEYWGKMDAALQTIRDSAEAIQGDRVTKLRVSRIKGRWTDVKDQYMEYKTGVARLKDFFPASKVEN